MHVHFLGIAGTFMTGLALLTKRSGFKVTGQDQNIYPPMSTQLSEADIAVTEGYAIADLPEDADLIVIGNVMARGMPIIEYILSNDLPFASGPGFLSEFILLNKKVLVVTGTHGKTTTTSMLAWILEYAGLSPGYLIGGLPKNFVNSAKIGRGQYFVIEGDEYDCAFFDKRSKFIHYRPYSVIINNIEFDHADIFKNIDEIIKQFHNLIRIIPPQGSIIFNQQDQNIEKLLSMGSWSKLQPFNLNYTDDHKESNEFQAIQRLLQSNPIIVGEHNLHNAMAACLAAISIGVDPKKAATALNSFAGVARRMEYKGCNQDIYVYDDFAHHPTAIAKTLAGLQHILSTKNSTQNMAKVSKDARLVLVLDLGSNTLKLGINNSDLVAAVQMADLIYLYADLTNIAWDVDEIFFKMQKPGKICTNLSELLTNLIEVLQPKDYVLFMSNGRLATAADELLAKLDI